MGTYLVTGAAGFIAARTTELLLEAGHVVVGIDNLNDYYDIRLKEHRLVRLRAHSRFSFVPTDIEDPGALAPLFSAHKFDAVINLAARAGVRPSIEHPRPYFATNVDGTLNLLDLMREHAVKKFVLASSSSLYAGQPLPFSEELPVNTPISPYAASKKAAEVLAYSYHHLHGIDCSILRYFTAYGPASRPDMGLLRFTSWIDRGHPIELLGDGSQARDFTYIDDIARGTIAALRPLGYEIINLGGGHEPVTIAAIIAKLETLLGKKAILEKKPFHPADMKETRADISKAARLLGWTPQVSIDDGLRQSVEWYRANRDWLRDVKL
jgi:nucleoside-diphosphate-sugar epimerase